MDTNKPNCWHLATTGTVGFLKLLLLLVKYLLVFTLLWRSCFIILWEHKSDMTNSFHGLVILCCWQLTVSAEHCADRAVCCFVWCQDLNRLRCPNPSLSATAALVEHVISRLPDNHTDYRLAVELVELVQSFLWRVTCDMVLVSHVVLVCCQLSSSFIMHADCTAAV